MMNKVRTCKIEFDFYLKLSSPNLIIVSKAEIVIVGVITIKSMTKNFS